MKEKKWVPKSKAPLCITFDKIQAIFFSSVQSKCAVCEYSGKEKVHHQGPGF